jgi:UDP-2-acetamido-2-deoxy-ribo-hexuluronate aminotransferase
MEIDMVNLRDQYRNIETEIDHAIKQVLTGAHYINGPQVKEFEQNLGVYLGGANVIGCANGTDALQIALMALKLAPGDEVIVPSFTYVATAEVIGLLGLTPVMVDVDEHTFNITAELIAPAITAKTKVIVPVHLFGQCADMEAILELANLHGIKVIEDTAQALSAAFTFSNGEVHAAGTMGHIGCTSFFPSKNLGCYGDGGAVFTSDASLAQDIKMISNHGQRRKYYHEVLGVNSRLDTLQAAILGVKLPHLDNYSLARNKAASFYDEQLRGLKELIIPARMPKSTHVYHQYTLRIRNGKRDGLQEYLKHQGIPSMIYYPLPLYEQKAFKGIGKCVGSQSVTEMLCREVLSLPIHTELDQDTQLFITDHIKRFFHG